MEDEQSNLIKKSSDLENSFRKVFKYDQTKTPSDEKVCRNYIIFSVIFILGLVIFLIFGYKSTLNDDKLSRMIQKPFFDARSFKTIELNNDIKILLIQNNSTETSTLSLELSVGFNAETGEIPGISHMLAHLILMNSKQYPNFYFDYYLNKHGGDANLLIEEERTNFYFSVNYQYLEKAMEIFAHHLKEPNFIRENFAGTIDLIDKEASEELEVKNNKILSLVKKIANKDHIFSKFFQGNKETLFDLPNKKKIDIFYEIDWYFKEYYSGNLMNIVIISNHSIEFLEKIVKENFLQLKNNRMPLKNMALYPKPFPFNSTAKVILLEAESSGIEINLLFPMDELISHYKSKPLNYLASLFNKKGPHSFQWVLLNKKLIYSMEAGIFYESSDFSLFYCKFIIPKENEDKILHLLKLFYAYKNFILKFGVKSEFFSELNKISTILFNFDDKTDEFTEVQRIAENLRILPLSNILNGDRVYFNYDEKLINSFLNSINPKNSITVISQKGFDINEDFVRNQKKGNEEFNNNNFNTDRNNSQIFRFTDLNSLKEELQVLKEKSSFKNKFIIPNKYKMMNMYHLYNESVTQNTNINETDFSEILKIPLDSFDELNKIFYKTSLFLSPETILNLEENNDSFLNKTVKVPQMNKFISSNLTIYSSCKDEIISNSTSINSNASQNISDLDELNKNNKLYKIDNINLTINRICIKNEEKLQKSTIELLQNNQTSFPIYYKFETKGNLPRVSIYFDLVFNSSMYTTKTNMMFLIFSQTLYDYIESQMYEALEAGSFFEIKANHHGFEIHLEGFNDQINKLKESFFKEFFNVYTNEFFFERIKEVLIRKIKEEKFDDPIRKSIKMFQKIMTNYNHIYQEKIYELDGIDFNNLENFFLNFSQSLLLNKIFIYGNYLKNDTLVLIDEIIEIFKSPQINSNISFHENLVLEQPIDNDKETNLTTHNFSNILNNSLDNASVLIIENITKIEELEPNLTDYVIINQTNLKEENSTKNNSINSNITNNLRQKNESDYNAEIMNSLFYSNVSYIPLSFLNLSNLKIRFLFDDEKNDFNDKYILLNYFQYGIRNDMKNNTLLWMISLYLDSKFDEFIKNFSSFSQKSIKKVIQTHLEKNIDGFLLILELKNDINMSCIEFLLEKFYDFMGQEINQMTTKEIDVLKNKTFFLLSKIDGKFRQKGKRIWQEILNGNGQNYFHNSEIKNFVQNLTKIQIYEFYIDNLINKTNKLSIKILRKEKEVENNVNYKNNEYVCEINPKIFKNFVNEKNQTENLREKLIEEIKEFNSNSKENNIENIMELSTIPKFIFYF